MPRTWDENGNPVANTAAAPRTWDENGNPVSGGTPAAPAGPGRGGYMPAGTPTAQAPDPSTLPAMGRLAGGVDQMTNFGGNRPNQKLAGAHNAFTGAAELAAPLAIPGLIGAPAATIGAGLLGIGGKMAGTAIPRMMGASPEASDVIGDVASVPSAMLGGAAGESVGPAMGRFISRGVPSWATDAVGMVSPHTAFLMRSAGRIADILKSGDPAFEPVRPNPAVAARMRFGGPVDESGGSAYPRVGMSGRPDLVPAEDPTFSPFKPSPSVAARMRFGGAADEEGGAAYSGVGMSGAPEPPVPNPFKPVKRSTTIARKLGREAPSDEGGGTAFGPVTRKAGTPAADLPPIKMPGQDIEPPSTNYAGPIKINPAIAKKLRFTPGKEDLGTGGTGRVDPTVGTRAEMMRQQRLLDVYRRGQAQPNDAK